MALRKVGEKRVRECEGVRGREEQDSSGRGSEGLGSVVVRMSMVCGQLHGWGGRRAENGE